MLTKKQLENAMGEYKLGRDPVGIIQRLGGNKEDYQKLYKWIKFKKKPF